MNMYTFANLEAWASRFYPGAKNGLSLVPYAYPLSFIGLTAAGTAGATALQTLNFQANADFIFTNIEYQAYISGALAGATNTAAVVPGVRLLLTDSGSSQPMMNAAVNLATYAQGVLQAANGLPYPRFLSGRSSLQVQLTNFSTESYQIDLTLHGVNVRAL